MLTFFKHIGLGIMSAYMAFTSAFHSTSTTQPLTTETDRKESEISTTTNIYKDEKVVTVETASKSNMQTPVTNQPNKIVSTLPTVSDQIAPKVINYYSYSNLPSDFSKNPPFYIGKLVKVSGIVRDFMAAGDRGGTTNYIEINPNISNIPYIALEISSTKNYHDSAALLIESDSVTAYGVISKSQNFLTTNNTADNSMVLTPVIKIIRLDKCNSEDCKIEPGVFTIFPYDVSTQPLTSMFAIFDNPSIFRITPFITQGKVIDIVNSDSGNSIIFLQDPKDGRGIISFATETSSVFNNNIKLGSTIEIRGNISTATGRMIYDPYRLEGTWLNIPYADVTRYTVININ